MSDAATSRQRQFLTQLGYKTKGDLSKQQASKLIDKLLADEKASGRTFPCPYCKNSFGPRPKREKKCPSCGNTIIHLSGRFYKESQANKLFQSEWLKESRRNTKEEVTEEWKEEKKYRREYGEPLIVGYKVTAGESCLNTKHLEGLLFLIEDVYDMPDMLPPFDECRHDKCECEFSPVMADEVDQKMRVAEWSDPETQAKLKTRKTSRLAVKEKAAAKKSGCLSVMLLVSFLIALLTVVA